jgi:protein-tyrosine phosphatase
MGMLLRGLAFLFAASIGWAEVADATVEPIGTHRFRIAFNLAPADAPVSIFASHLPDRVEDTKPLVVTSSSPDDVHVQGWKGRPYFHLKTATGGTRVVSIRRLPLEGQSNFRDLGGYRTADGKYVRWGLLYRSGQLAALTEGDYEYLQPLGIRLVCDFRSGEERSRQATHWPGDAPEFLSTPIGADASGRNTRIDELRKLLKERAAPEQMRAFMMSVYPDMPLAAATQFQRVLTRLLSAQGASMVHCSAGKDRTGVFSALLLLTLGVPRETVIEDYLLTNRYVLADDSIARTAVAYQKLAGLDSAPPTEVLKPLVSVDRSYIEAALETIDKEYGSFDEYRRKKLLSDSDVAKLRARYLEP